MPAKNSYREQLKGDMSKLIEEPNLSDLQKHFLRSRWLDQVLWMDGRTNSTHKRHYFLRLTMIIGGVIVPALVSLNLSEEAGSVIRWATFGISLLVAISAASEGFLHYGDQWQHYRRTVELLKTEGWQFFEQNGPYVGKSHTEAYPIFTARVEDIIQHDIEAYFTKVVTEKEEKEKEASTENDVKKS